MNRIAAQVKQMGLKALAMGSDSAQVKQMSLKALGTETY